VGEGTNLTAFSTREKACQEMDQQKGLARKRKKNKETSKNVHAFTLAIATCPSVILEGSAEAEGTRSLDLAGHSTRPDFTVGSTPKKSTTSIDLLIDASTTHRWRA